jgi:hypothetical protein
VLSDPHHAQVRLLSLRFSLKLLCRHTSSPPPFIVAVWFVVHPLVCSSSSMEECEALCGKVGIMVDGQLQVCPLLPVR